MQAENDSTENGGLRRRELLVAGAAGATALTLAGPLNQAAFARGRRLPIAKEGKFAAGVMSGLPSTDGITLWTRLSEIDRSSRLTLQVSTDKHFKKVIREKQVVASKKQGFGVHTRIGGLKPHQEYFYRFETKDNHSRVGTFKTFPPKGSAQEVKIGYFSCQSYEAGYYNAQAGLAKEKDLDLIICLGDYIYETSFFDGPADRADTTGRLHNGDCEYLDEYREKYAFYQADPDLQAMHAAYPFLAVWDDHEVEDNYAGNVSDPQNGGPNETKSHGTTIERRVPFQQRRINGYRAFFESMPRIRMKKDLSRVYGSTSIGSLCDVFLLDERQYRDVQPCDDKLLQTCPADTDPGRTLLGANQKQWLKTGLASSKAKWKILGNNDMLMSLDLPAGNHVNPDQWDGYAAERTEIGQYVLDNGVKNVVAATGDIHTFLVGTVTTTGDLDGKPWATEFVGGSATSTGIPESLGFPPATLAALAKTNDPHVIYSDFVNRGYGVLTVSPDECVCELKSVDRMIKGDPAVLLAKFSVADGAITPQQI